MNDKGQEADVGAAINKGLGQILDKVEVEGLIKVFDKDGKLKRKMKIVSLKKAEELESNGT